ncbi:specifically androgen-regulated gene protein-like [Polyodon spathula]|uniref:specifically androgen-regulated gene protein-like n=1 Tax=Polyodon spathula TaxID=7913 RepID=UPI001B7F2C56|nr:specifically androgen-regulated gene protein-like [Polyodon spathula]
MPKSDTWPGVDAMDSITSVGSAGSRDSVVSLNSNHSALSDDSLEYLSAEERACLMFLEETIDSLDTEGNDSGLSNDETTRSDKPSTSNVASKQEYLSSSIGSYRLEGEYKSANDSPALQRSKGSRPMSQALVPASLLLANSGPNTLPKAGLKQAPESIKLSPRSQSCMSDPGGITSGIHPEKLGEQASLKAEKPESTPLDPKPSRGHVRNPSKTNLGVITPPAGFRDGLEKARAQHRGSERSSPSGGQHERNKITFESSTRPENSLTGLGARPAIQPNPATSRFLHLDSSPSTAVPSDAKHGPPTAPKPTRLPSNIVMKSLKRGGTTFHNQDSLGTVEHGSPNHIPSSTEKIVHNQSHVSDPQRSRREALLKLGLLKGEPEQDWHSSPFHLPDHHSSMELPGGDTQAKPLLAKVEDKPRSSNMRPRADSDVLAVIDKRSPARPASFKAATLERSGMGLSSYVVDTPVKSNLKPNTLLESPSLIRNSRPRPFSLGTGKDFADIQQEEKTERPKDIRRSFPAPHGPSKLPRSQGISVQITPRTGEDRREALKKLGLLKD